MIRALGLIGFLVAAGCASARTAAVPPRPRISLEDRKVYVAPIADPRGLLDEREEAFLRGNIAVGVLAMAGRKGGFDVAFSREAADFALDVEVKEFGGPDHFAGLVLGFGAGRPGYEVEVRMGLELARFGETSTRFECAPDGPRRAMLRAIEREVVGFVRRRR